MPKRARWVFYPYRTKWMFHHRKHASYQSYSARSLSSLEIFDHPNYPCVSADDELFFGDRDDDFIQKRSAEDFSYSNHIGTHGSGNDQFNEPAGICCVGNYIFVNDRMNSRIVKRNKSDLSYVSQYGSIGFGDNQFYYPEGICSDGTYLYIADSSAHRIKKHLVSDFSFVSKIGTQGAGNDQFNYPHDVAIFDDYLFVVDRNNNRIHKRLTSDLSFVSKIGSAGSGNDQFNFPEGICADLGSSLYITDSGNDRLLKRSATDLSFMSKVGVLGSGDDEFNYPHGVAYSNGFIFVADSENHRLVKRKTNLAYVDQVGGAIEGTPANGKSWVTLFTKLATAPLFIYAIQLTTSGSWAGTPKYRLLYDSHKLYPDLPEETVQSGTFVVFPTPLYVHRNMSYSVQFRSTSAADGSPDQLISLDRLSVSHYGPWR